jgi:hypothetical protein
MFSKVVDGFLLCSGFLFSPFSSSMDIIWGAPCWNRIISLLVEEGERIGRPMRFTKHFGIVQSPYQGPKLH